MGTFYQAKQVSRCHQGRVRAENLLEGSPGVLESGGGGGVTSGSPRWKGGERECVSEHPPPIF